MLISELLTYARSDHENFRLQKEMLDLGPWLIGLICAENQENGPIHIDCRGDSADPMAQFMGNFYMSNL